jgi:hypothetical protein
MRPVDNRVALGAKRAVSQPSAQFQNRVNRKLGISNNAKKEVNGKSKKREIQESETDSEEDSKSKLVSKRSFKKEKK